MATAVVPHFTNCNDTVPLTSSDAVSLTRADLVGVSFDSVTRTVNEGDELCEDDVLVDHVRPLVAVRVAAVSEFVIVCEPRVGVSTIENEFVKMNDRDGVGGIVMLVRVSVRTCDGVNVGGGVIVSVSVMSVEFVSDSDSLRDSG